MMRRYRLSTCLFLAAMSFQAHAQQTQPAPGATPVPAVPGQMPGPLPADSIRPDYVLGPNDQILIRAPGAEELTERPFRIDSEGYVNLPLVGRVRAGGLTVRELEAELTKRLREFIVQPQVIISVVQFRSEPVFFVGAFARPGDLCFARTPHIGGNAGQHRRFAAERQPPDHSDAAR